MSAHYRARVFFRNTAGYAQSAPVATIVEAEQYGHWWLDHSQRVRLVVIETDVSGQWEKVESLNQPQEAQP